MNLFEQQAQQWPNFRMGPLNCSQERKLFPDFRETLVNIALDYNVAVAGKQKPQDALKICGAYVDAETDRKKSLVWGMENVICDPSFAAVWGEFLVNTLKVFQEPQVVSNELQNTIRLRGIEILPGTDLCLLALNISAARAVRNNLVSSESNLYWTSKTQEVLTASAKEFRD